MLRDITERKQAEEAVKVSEVRYRRLFEAARDGILILNADTGQIVDVNPFLIEMLGFSYEEFLGKKLWEIGLFKNIVASKDAFLELQTKGYVRFEDMPLETKGGRHISVEFVSNVYLVDHTKVIQCNIRNITDRVLAENMERESRNDLNRAQAVAHIGSWRMDVKRNVLTWSDENHRIFGIPKGTSMTYETFLSKIHPDDLQMVNQKWLDALKGEPYDIEHRIVVDGQIKWVREIADLEFDKNGVLLGGFGTTEDITDRKNYEEQISDLAKFPSENPFAVLRVENSGKIVYANNAGVELLKFWQRKLGQNVPADWQKLINEALKTHQNIIREVALDNSVVSFAITPIHDNGYVNIYGRDITEYKNAEEKLQEINTELETRVRQRTKQLQELVNALQSEVLDRIKAENGLLENQDKLRLMSQELVLAEERERRELATQLHDSIGQLLAFSKKELGALSRNAPETLKSSLEKVWELIKQAVEQTRTLTFDLSSATLYAIGLEAAIEELAEDFAKDYKFKLHFRNDANQKTLTEQFKVLLYRAVRELLINISKHSNAHNVYIDIRKIKDSICIIVKDDGIGLDIAGLESKKGKLKGFGLFSLQERLANIGGSFDIKSKPGSGMTVKLTTPLAESKGE